jgi:TonB family protein
VIPWPSILPAEPESAAPEPVALLSATALDADGVDPGFPTAASGGESAASATAALAEPAGARWNAAALVASLIVHAAAIAGFGVLVAQDGLEAETDAIHVELVVEPASEPAAEASIAGDASETREAAASADAAEPGATSPERPAAPEPLVAEADAPGSDAPAEPTALPRFEPLPPLTRIEAAGEQDDAPAPDEPASDPDIDVAAAVPDFSPLAPLTGIPPGVPMVAVGEPAAVEQPDVEEPGEARTERVPEPVLAVAPSLETMLPRIEVPPPPLFPPPNEAKSAAAAAAKKPEAQAAARKSVAPPISAAKPAKAPERSNARKTATKSAARAEKPERSATAPPPGGAKAKGKAQKATQAGSLASAASSGDRESYGRKVNSHVQRYKRYPDAAARSGMKGSVKVSISIGGSGTLAAARVTASSGYPALDGEALATVRRAAPYPRPPAAFGGTARLSLTLRYSK